MHETFRTLLTDRAHWEFEIFGQLLFDVLLGAILYPWLSKHIRHHLARDKKEESETWCGFTPWKIDWSVEKPPFEVGKTYSINGEKRECVAEGVTVGRSDVDKKFNAIMKDILAPSSAEALAESAMRIKYDDLTRSLFDAVDSFRNYDNFFVEHDGTPTGETEMAKPKATMDVTQGAEIISDATDAVPIDLAIETSVKVAHNLSSNVRFNLAAYLKYDIGSNLKGMDDRAWLESAESILKVVSNR